MTKYIKLAILLILTATIITACGNNNNPDTTDNAPPAAPITLDTEPAPIIFGGDPITLTVFADERHTPMIWEIERDMQEYFAERGIDFSIALTDYDRFISNAYTAEQNALLRAKLAAGDGYDVIFLNHLALDNRFPMDVRSLADNGFLLNVYDLIDQDPNLTRDDFFTNVFAAMEHRGGLYNFPFTFAIELMGINANLPDSIVNDFMQKNSVSMLEIMQMLNILQNEYPEVYANFLHTVNLGEFTAPRHMINRVSVDFIDFENATAYFDGANFANFANVVRDTLPISRPEHVNSSTMFVNFETRAQMNHVAENYMFLSVVRGGFNPNDIRTFATLIPLFGMLDSPFLNFVPVADNNGVTKIFVEDVFQATANVIFPAVGDGRVAWDFTQRMLHRTLTADINDATIWGTNWGVRSLAIPILRNELEPLFHRVIEEFSFFFRNMDIVPLIGLNFGIDSPETTDAATAAALAKLTELANRPVSMWQARGGVAFNTDALDSFMLGEISAEELGAEFQNNVSLWIAGEWEE
ncbi:MAG: hypothetical protein FWG68_09755 [Defluviitaleaceae bacterium]|nr:hypothetical protein [Defluviitaleaceae bacterium]